MSRVLFLTQILPYPLDSGARVRQYYVLRYLARSHHVTLASFVRADDRPEHVAHLQEFCGSVHTVPMARSRGRDVRAGAKGLLSGRPIVIERDTIAEMQALVEGLIAREGCDVVHADQVSMAQYGLLGRGPRRVLDLHNAMYMVTERLAQHEPNPLKRLITRREARALARYEAGLGLRFDRVVFVTDEDRRAIEARMRGRELEARARFSTIPICVDTDDKPVVAPVEAPHRVTALGTMFWPPNAEGVLWFAREVWPRVHGECPQARFTVVGKNPPAEVQALHGVNGVEVTGFVADPAPLLAETAAFVVPLRAGGGMRVKIVDAWCWGLPIVSTAIGAEGIAVRDGENILLADAPAAFAAAVACVLREPALAHALRANGRRWVEERYDWRRVYQAWDEVYAGAGVPVV